MNIIEPELHENCLRCGRKLRSDESKILGYGPTCWEKSKQEAPSISLFDMPSVVGHSNRVCDISDN